MSYPEVPIYPDIISDIPGTIPFDYGVNHAILKTEFASGQEHRRLIWQAPRRNVVVHYTAMSYSQANRLWSFYRSMNGPYQSFAFFFPRIRIYWEELVGVSVGYETVINLPCVETQTVEFYELRRGNVILEEGCCYTLSFGTGPAGEDQAIILEPAENGANYFWSFTGRLKIKARFDERQQHFSDLKDIMTTADVNLVGLQHEIA